MNPHNTAWSVSNPLKCNSPIVLYELQKLGFRRAKPRKFCMKPITLAIKYDVTLLLMCFAFGFTFKYVLAQFINVIPDRIQPISLPDPDLQTLSFVGYTGTLVGYGMTGIGKFEVQFNHVKLKQM